jgi:hypothetical protein
VDVGTRVLVKDDRRMPRRVHVRVGRLLRHRIDSKRRRDGGNPSQTSRSSPSEEENGLGAFRQEDPNDGRVDRYALERRHERHGEMIQPVGLLEVVVQRRLVADRKVVGPAAQQRVARPQLQQRLFLALSGAGRVVRGAEVGPGDVADRVVEVGGEGARREGEGQAREYVCGGRVAAPGVGLLLVLEAREVALETVIR